MYVVIAHVQVEPGHEQAFTDAIEHDARHSVADEPGCHGFDVLRSVDDPLSYVFHETYTDRAAFEAHQATPHYAVWDEASKTATTGEGSVTFCEVSFSG